MVFNTVPRDDYAPFVLWLLQQKEDVLPKSPYVYRILSVAAAVPFDLVLPLLRFSRLPASVPADYVRATAALAALAYTAADRRGLRGRPARPASRPGAGRGAVRRRAAFRALLRTTQISTHRPPRHPGRHHAGLRPPQPAAVRPRRAGLDPGRREDLHGAHALARDPLGAVRGRPGGPRRAAAREPGRARRLSGDGAADARAGHSSQVQQAGYLGTIAANLAVPASARGVVLNLVPTLLLAGVAVTGWPAGPLGPFRRVDILVIPALVLLALTVAQNFQVGRLVMHAAPLFVVPAAAAGRRWHAHAARSVGGARDRRHPAGPLGMTAPPALPAARRLVVKIGSALVIDPARGAPRASWLAGVAADIADLRARGTEVIVVSSGAILALARRSLGLTRKRLRLEEKQAAAAVGQIRLAQAWAEALSGEGLTAAQLLLTLEDTEDRRRYLNARATLHTLLALGAVPVINENDTVATAEIHFGDNDQLAARVAAMSRRPPGAAVGRRRLYTPIPAGSGGGAHPRGAGADAGDRGHGGRPAAGLFQRAGCAPSWWRRGSRPRRAAPWRSRPGDPDRPLRRWPGRALHLVPARTGRRSARKRWIAGALAQPGCSWWMPWGGAARWAPGGPYCRPECGAAREFERGDAVLVQDARAGRRGAAVFRPMRARTRAGSPGTGPTDRGDPGLARAGRDGAPGRPGVDPEVGGRRAPRAPPGRALRAFSASRERPGPNFGGPNLAVGTSAVGRSQSWPAMTQINARRAYVIHLQNMHREPGRSRGGRRQMGPGTRRMGGNLPTAWRLAGRAGVLAFLLLVIGCAGPRSG